MNDFMIPTATLENHLNVLQEVFRLLVKNKLTLGVDKCKIFVRQNRLFRLPCITRR